MTTFYRTYPVAKYPRRTIQAGEVYTVELQEVMISYQQVEIEDTAELEIIGEVAILD